MAEARSYFFCGIGGSGMLPLASIVRTQGHEVAGSDRSLDQGRLADKFTYLERQGIRLFAQDGSGVTSPDQTLVTSGAIEETVPDVQAAIRVGAARMTRPQLLSALFNASPVSIGVAGTSGKSTVTGMIAWILHCAGRDPAVMNGAVMKNFASPDMPFASALAGGGDIFVSEIDESDGSIALYEPSVAVLNNISLDHKSIEELRQLFGDFARRAGTVVANLDDDETAQLAAALPRERLTTISFADPSADLHARDLEAGVGRTRFTAVRRDGGESVAVTVPMWGTHNAHNGLAALAATLAVGVPLAAAAEALGRFRGLRRRFDVVGQASGVTVIDDFGHNPEKIAATLQAARAGLEGRLLVFFQPHGYGPLRLMKDPLIATFAERLAPHDRLILSDPVYYGGTVERTVTSADIVAGVAAGGRQAEHIPDRDDCGVRLAALARPGDRIVIMGARDDTLSIFAEEVLARL